MAEKSLNDLSRDLRGLFNKGNEALLKDNLDYAISLFHQVLSKEPTFYEGRLALRSAQARKAGKGSGMFKKFLSNVGSSPDIAKGQFALRKDPAEALQIAEQILNSDPANGPAHRIIAEAATALEMPRTAVMSLEILARNSPRDRDTAIKLAHALADAGDTARAEKILTDLYRSFPNDNELAQALKNISARNTMGEGGYDALADGKGSYRDILKDKDQAVLLEQENRQVKTEDVSERLIREYSERLKSEPNNLKLVRSLAELHTQKKEFDQALSYYEMIKASDIGNDASLDRAISDTVAKRFDYQIAQLDPNSPEHAEQLAKLQADKQAHQLAESQKRVERFPTDLQFRFELGQMYFAAGKIGEAIKEFQKAQANPHRKIQSLSYLAQCFSRRGMFDLAANTLQDALKEKLVFDDEKKELLYILGGVFEKMGKLDEAIVPYKQIYSVDAGYRDVEAKVDKYYSDQSGG